MSAVHRTVAGQTVRNPRAAVRLAIAGTAGLTAVIALIVSTERAMPAAGVVAAAATPQFADDDWPWWRGPQRNGESVSAQSPPLTWSATENVLWQTPVPGRGYGSPCIVGNRLFLATAEDGEQLQ